MCGENFEINKRERRGRRGVGRRTGGGGGGEGG